MDDWTHTVTGGPWPERIGHRCHIIEADPDRDRYPWNSLNGDQVVVVVEHDPLGLEWDDPWSCVISASDLAPIEG